MECAAIQDVLVVGKALNKQESRERKLELDRVVAMLTRLGGRGYCVKENSVTYKSLETDPDPDPDPESKRSFGSCPQIPTCYFENK